MKKKLISLFILFSFSLPLNAFAGGAVAQQQQMQQMQQQQMYQQQMAIKQAQERAYQEAVQKRMMEYLAAKQAAEQKKAYQEAVYKKMYQKKLAEKVAYENAMKAAMQKKAAQAAYQQQLQQQVMFKTKMQKKVQQEYALAVATGRRKQELMRQYQEKQKQELIKEKLKQERVLQVGRERKKAAEQEEIEEEIVDIEHVWAELDKNSHVWDLMLDRQPKELTVQREIDQYREQGIIIKKSASYYTDRVDTMLVQNKELKQYPLKNILRILAVMDYDFNNGQNQDLMAMEVLGAKLYLENKKRPGLLDNVY